MKSKRALFFLLLLGIVGLTVAGTKVSRLTRTQTISSNDLFIVVTGSTVKATRHIRAHDLAAGLGPWITNSGSGGSSSSTAGIFTNVIYVNANGASQAANGALLTNAFESDLQGVRIIVGPGDYFVEEVAVPSPAFSQDNRIIEFQPGVNFRAGTLTGNAFFFFDDSAGKRTNVHVVGRANFFQTNAAAGSGSLIYLENGSTVTFEHQNYWNTNGDSTFTMGGIGNNTLTFITHGRASTWSYDNAYFNGSMTNRLYAFQNEIESVGDILEVSGDAKEWGDVVFGFNKAWARNGTAGQASLMQLGGRVIVKNGVLVNERTNASIYSTSATTNGLIEGGMILMPPNGQRSVLEDNSAGTGAPLNGMTALWLKDIFIRGSTNVDAFSLTNGTVNETILENVRIEPGWASTNVIRATTPSKVRIIGNLEVHPYRPFGTGITLVGTNAVSSMRNVGTLINHGAAYFSNLVYAAGNITSGGTLSGADITSAGSIDGVDISASGQLGTAALNIGNPTPSSILRVNSNGDVTNAAIGTGLSFDGTTLSATGSGGGGGTNNPVLFSGGTLALIANQTSRHQHSTNASFAWTIAGSSNRSSVFFAQFENTSTNTIYATNVNGFYSVGLGSNAITTLTLPGNSMLLVDGYLDVSNRWVLTETFAGYALEFANGTTATNHTTKTISYTAPTTGSVTNNGITNATVIGQVAGTSAIKTVTAGTGITVTDRGTNLLFASTASGASFNETNITVSTTAEVVVDLAAFDVVKIKLLTNLTTLTFSNPATMGKRAQIYFQQDTNGQRTIAANQVAGGLLQTNANLQPTTNANGLDMLEIMPGFFSSNAVAWWPQNFQPRVAFTNSLAGGGASYVPTDTAGLLVWLAADDGVTNTSNVNPPSNADSVGGIADKSGNNRFFISPGGGSAPTYRTAVQNGKPVIRFTAASTQYLSNSFGSTLNGTDVSATITVMASVVATNVAGYFLNIRNGADSDSAWWSGITAAGRMIGFKRTDSGTPGQVEANGVNAATFYNFTWVISGTTCEIYTNNVLAATGTLTTGAITFDSSWIGRVGSGYLNGDIGEMLIRNTALSPTDRTKDYDYLKARWGTP